MQIDDVLAEINELEERFLKADEKLEELPNPEKPDDDKEETELDHMLDILSNNVAAAHATLAFLNKPRFQSALKDYLNEDAMKMLKELEVSLDTALKLLDPDTFEEQEEYEEPEEKEDDELESEIEEPEASEEEPAEEPDEKERDAEAGDDDEDANESKTL